MIHIYYVHFSAVVKKCSTENSRSCFASIIRLVLYIALHIRSIALSFALLPQGYNIVSRPSSLCVYVAPRINNSRMLRREHVR